MQQIASEIERYGLLFVFLDVFLAEIGLPLPAFPILVVAAAFAIGTPRHLAELIIAGASGSMLAGLAWYWAGQRYGSRVLGLICKMSLSPDFCVRQTETVFLKVGPWSLLFAKFFPGLSTMSVAMAGVTRMPFRSFLLLNGAGALLFVGVSISLGRLFQNAIASVLLVLADIGKYSFFLVLAALAFYIIARWWRRQAFIRQLRGDRITVDELRRLIGEGHTPLILDVRPEKIRLQGGIIPGAISAHAADIDPRVATYPHDKEVVVYCACPNEASAAIAARQLKAKGFTRIRPLLGGIDAWIRRGNL